MSKENLHLPQTAFSMKADFPRKEPDILKKWEQNKIFEKIYLYKTFVTFPYQEKNKTISSSLIRKIISKGNVQEARKLLGRPWSIEGEVVKGEQRGSKIGFQPAILS